MGKRNEKPIVITVIGVRMSRSEHDENPADTETEDEQKGQCRNASGNAGLRPIAEDETDRRE